MLCNPFSLEGKTILITGASSGIGRATAILCSKMGASVVINGRDAGRLNDTFQSLEQNDAGHLQIVADIATDEGLDKLVSQLPKLDGVASNAGIGSCLPIPFLTKEKISHVFDINLFAPMLLTKQLAKKKILNKQTSVVYTSSVGGVWSAAMGNSVYGATKSALGAFLKAAALELASKGIRCNSVNPGMVDTPLIHDGAISSEQLEDDMKKNYPLGRYGKPEDIANAIVFLLSDASSWITGTELKIDGGSTLM